MGFRIHCYDKDKKECNEYIKDGTWNDLMEKYYDIDYWNIYKKDNISTEEIKKYYEDLKRIKEKLLTNEIISFRILASFMEHSIRHNHSWKCS